MLEVLRKGMHLLGTGRRARWVLLVLMGVGISVLEMVGAALIYVLLAVITGSTGEITIPLIEAVAPDDRSLSNSTLINISLTIGAFFILRGIGYLGQSYAQNRIAQNAGVVVSDRLLHGYLRMPYAFHLERNSSELIRNVQGISSELASYVFVPAVQLASEVLLVLGITTVVVFAAPVATGLVLLGLFPVVLLTLRLVQPRLATMGAASQELWSENLKSLQQGLQGIRDIRLGGREKFFQLQYLKSRAALARVAYLRGLLTDLPRVVIETSVILATLVFLTVSVVLIGTNDSAFPILGLFTYTALRILPSVNRIVANLNMVKFGAAGINILFEDLKLLERLSTETPATREVAFEDRIEVTKVSFRYGPTEPLVLHDVNFTVRKGEFVGIVGSTGSGKTTLVDIILGLLTPQEGAVEVDGINIEENLRSWHRHIGLVSQQLFVLDDTIRNNVALGTEHEEIDDERVWWALETAQLAEFVQGLPRGVNSFVGERGVRISGGERQRLTIARALYRDPQLLIFDEGTSALDSATEEKVISALRRHRPRKTMVHIAHRLTTLREAGLIVVLENGRVVDTGRFPDLAQESEAFRRIATPSSGLL